MKRTFFIFVLAGLTLPALAQADSSRSVQINLSEMDKESKSEYISVFDYWKEHDIFQHLDLSLTAGTSGVGIELSSPVTEWARLRVGYEYMPRFSVVLPFNMTIGGQPVKSYDEYGNRQETTFDRMREFLYEFTGYEVEDHADMEAKPTMHNLKVMVDVYPFKNNRHWHFTGGFFWGPSTFADAVNTTETMVSLVSAGIYNSMYEKAINGEPLIDFSKFQDMPDVVYKLPDAVVEKFKSFGRLGFAVGYYAKDVVDEDGVGHSAGERYIVEPNENSMVLVKAKSAAFKPYLGFGYGGRLLKKRDDWRISFDLGAMFWGGVPDLYVHDGMNLTQDIDNIEGQVGTYVDLAKTFKVYPILSLRLTKRLF